MGHSTYLKRNMKVFDIFQSDMATTWILWLPPYLSLSLLSAIPWRAFSPDFRTSIIIKRIPEERSFSHKFHDCSRLFQNEITAYEMILPMCLKYLKENSWEDVNNEFCFPRYYGQCQMFLVVQDLATEGYQVVNRVKGFSKKECSVILQVRPTFFLILVTSNSKMDRWHFRLDSFQELSRFHAVSFALKKREKQLFSDMKDRLIETVFREEYREGLLGVIWENSLKFAARSLNESNCPKLRKVSEKLQSYSGRVLSTLIDLSNSKCSKFNVICHGDLWNNNILLRWDNIRNNSITNVHCARNVGPLRESMNHRIIYTLL